MPDEKVYEGEHMTDTPVEGEATLEGENTLVLKIKFPVEIDVKGMIEFINNGIRETNVIGFHLGGVYPVNEKPERRH